MALGYFWGICRSRNKVTETNHNHQEGVAQAQETISENSQEDSSITEREREHRREQIAISGAHHSNKKKKKKDNNNCQQESQQEELETQSEVLVASPSKSTTKTGGSLFASPASVNTESTASSSSCCSQSSSSTPSSSPEKHSSVVSIMEDAHLEDTSSSASSKQLNQRQKLLQDQFLQQHHRTHDEHKQDTTHTHASPEHTGTTNSASTDNNNTNHNNNNNNHHHHQAATSTKSNASRGRSREKQLMAIRSVKAAHNLLRERDAQVNALQNEVNALSNKLAGLGAVTSKSGKRYFKRRSKRRLPMYGTVVVQDDGDGPSHAAHGRRGQMGRSPSSNRRRLPNTSKREHLGRNASISTAQVLQSLPEDHDDPLAEGVPNPKHREEMRAVTERISSMFRDPSSRTNMSYLRSEQFASDMLRLNKHVGRLLEEEPRCCFLQSPCYVFGDIHGNLEDLHFFSDNIWRLGMTLTAGNFCFLGDYVDRGMSCLEVVSYLLCMKLQLPRKVHLLRGNHETRDVNGWEEHYGVRSFLHQCRERFGDELGYRIWESTNQVFDRLPLAAVIDQDIFCVHGGIPRPIGVGGTSGGQYLPPPPPGIGGAGKPSSPGGGPNKQPQDRKSRIQDILRVPRVAGINPPYEHENDTSQQVASDCIWSDPASEEQEANGSVDQLTGFGASLRGGGAVCFGHRAVTDFLRQHDFSYIMRAHEAHAEGVAVSKGARVFTVFSTSKDHNQGSQAMAGCILVESERMRVINRSPAYKNQYVHRRDSVSLAALSESEINQRIELGLVTPEELPASDSDDDYDLEEWDDFVEDDDDDEEEGGGGGFGDEGEMQHHAHDDNDDDHHQEGERMLMGESNENIEDVDEDDDEDHVVVPSGGSHYVIDTKRHSAVDPSSTVSSPVAGEEVHDHHLSGGWMEGGSSAGVGGGPGGMGGSGHFDNLLVKKPSIGNIPRMSSVQEETDEDDSDKDGSALEGDAVFDDEKGVGAECEDAVMMEEDGSTPAQK